MKIAQRLNRISLALALSIIAGTQLTACATDISSNSYAENHVGEAARSFRGIVVKVREVKVAPSKPQYGGALAGAGAGGLVGNQFGAGAGKDIMTAGGAVAGAVGGYYAEKHLRTQMGLEITVQMPNGELRTLVQGNDVAFRKGDRVMIMIYNRGRSKIVKDDV